MTTQELQAKLEAAEANVKALEKEYDALGDEENKLKQRLEEIKKRRHELYSVSYSSHGHGLIERAKSTMEEANRRLSDSRLPKFTVTSTLSHKKGTFEAVVVKVTPKRIYMREVGSDGEVIIPRDGSNPPWGWKYDHAELLKFAGV